MSFPSLPNLTWNLPAIGCPMRAQIQQRPPADLPVFSIATESSDRNCAGLMQKHGNCSVRTMYQQSAARKTSGAWAAQEPQTMCTATEFCHVFAAAVYIRVVSVAQHAKDPAGGHMTHVNSPQMEDLLLHDHICPISQRTRGQRRV